MAISFDDAIITDGLKTSLMVDISKEEAKNFLDDALAYGYRVSQSLIDTMMRSI